MEQLKEVIEILKTLLKEKSGVFIIGVIVAVVPAYFIVTTLTKDIEKKERELDLLNDRVLQLETERDLCNANINKAFDEGRESAIKYIEYSKTLLEDIESKLGKKERRLREEINKIKNYE